MGIIKKFRCSYEELILVARTIINSAILNLADIVANKPAYKDPFFPDLLLKFNTVADKYLGVDSAGNLKKATKNITAVMESLEKTFRTFHNNIEADFKKDKAKIVEIFDTLGFTKYYSAAVERSNQSAMDNLLAQFNKNLTPELEQLIITKGMNADVISLIKTSKTSVADANVVQEGAKGDRPVNTAEAVSAFNDAYDDLMAVSLVCKDVFAEDKLRRDLFSFDKVLKNIRGGDRGGANDSNQTPPPATN